MKLTKQESFMKLIYIILIALGTGVVGFLAGGGVGALGGGAVGAGFGSINGICMAVDAAGNKGILTQADIEKLGNELANAQPGIASTIKNTKLSIDSADKSCKQILQVMAKAAK
jgi:hypothetical protein